MPRASKQLSHIQHEQFELEGQLHDLRRCPVTSFTLRRAHELIRQWLLLSRYRQHLNRNRLGWVVAQVGLPPKGNSD